MVTKQCFHLFILTFNFTTIWPIPLIFTLGLTASVWVSHSLLPAADSNGDGSPGGRPSGGLDES